MGFGTGVRIAIYPIYLIYGVTVGVAGTNLYYIAKNVGIDQSLLATSRGIGMCLGPFFCSRMIGRLVWRGEPMTMLASILVVKGMCFFVLPDLCNHFLLMLAMFTAGVMMSLVYVAVSYIAGQCYGDEVGGALIFYGAFYQLGAMVAPLIAVRVPDHAWSIVAGVDFAIAAWLFFKRFVYGKPKDWKSRACRVPAGLRSVGGATAAGLKDGPSDYSRLRVPRPVLVIGVLFNFVCQVAQTSISCWGFTWAVTVLGLPSREAAMIPSTFSLAFMVARFAVVLPASRRMLPSAIVHAGVVVALVGCTMLHLAVPDAGQEVVNTHLIKGALFLVGAGLCPHQAMVLSSMLRHGRLEVHEVGYYSASYNMGTTVGMWLPSVVPVHRICLPCSVVLVLLVNVSLRYFPRWGNFGTGLAQGEVLSPSRTSSSSLLPFSPKALPDTPIGNTRSTSPPRLPVLTPYTLRAMYVGRGRAPRIVEQRPSGG